MAFDKKFEQDKAAKKDKGASGEISSDKLDKVTGGIGGQGVTTTGTSSGTTTTGSGSTNVKGP